MDGDVPAEVDRPLLCQARDVPLVARPSVPPPPTLAVGLSPVSLLILPAGKAVHLAREAALCRDVLLLLLLFLLVVFPGGGETGEARRVDGGDTVSVPHTVVALGTVAAEGLTGQRVAAETAGRVRAAPSALDTDTQPRVVVIPTDRQEGKC